MDEIAELCAEFERLTGVPSYTMVGAPVRALRLIVEHLRLRATPGGVKPNLVSDDALAKVLLRAVTDGEVEALFVGDARAASAPVDYCAECGRLRLPRQHWARCATCNSDKVLHICPACVPVHQAVHAAAGDVDEPAPDFACETLEPVTAAELRLDEAVATFEERVAPVLGDKCTCCGAGVRVHIGGLCYLCWREAGKPEGPVQIVDAATATAQGGGG